MMLKGRCLFESSCGGEHSAARQRGWTAAQQLRSLAAAPRPNLLDSRESSSSCGGGRPQRQQWQQQQQQEHTRIVASAVPASAADAAPESADGSGSITGGGGKGTGGPAPAAADAPTAVTTEPRDMSLEPFKALVEGRRFFCTLCGKCCTGDGEIWVSPDEAARIARHLNMSLQRFLDTHTKQYSKYRGWRMLKTAEGSSACVFLAPDNKCSIHSVRPSQCSTYPWWPELTVDREWDWEKANVCEGFDHPEAGPLDVEEAARQLREANKMTQLRLLASEMRITPKVAGWADDVLLWDEELGGSEERAEVGGGGAAKPKSKPKPKAQMPEGSSGSGNSKRKGS